MAKKKIRTQDSRLKDLEKRIEELEKKPSSGTTIWYVPYYPPAIHPVIRPYWEWQPYCVSGGTITGSATTRLSAVSGGTSSCAFTVSDLQNIGACVGNSCVATAHNT